MSLIKREARGLPVRLIDFADVSVEMNFLVSLFPQSRRHP
jgi:hypothetical protein